MNQNNTIFMNSAISNKNSKNTIKLEKRRKIKRYKWCFVLLLIPVIHQLIFSYLPIYGVIIAFKDFKMARGIIGSSWAGLIHFKKLFNDIFFFRVLRNTLRLSLLNLGITFPCTIAFALLINEISNLKFKRVIQTISYLPHFLSWVVISGFVYQLLSPQSGFINVLLYKIGLIPQPINFMVLKKWFIPIYIISSLWQGIGWGTIIYLSAIAGIELSQYESAELDGAGRFQKVIYITLPGIVPTITILLLLRVGGILNVGFEQIFNLYNPSTYAVADVISTFVFRKGITDAKYDYSTAVGLFQNVVGFILLMIANYFTKKVNEYGVL
jgi:putative aldouronate transport system permease protein